MPAADFPKPPDPLAPPLRLIVALASLCAKSSVTLSAGAQKWYEAESTSWLQSVCKLLEFNIEQLPSSIEPSQVKLAADEQREEWSREEVIRIAGILIEASVAQDAQESAKKGNKEGSLRYTPVARALSYRTAQLLGFPANELIPGAEKNLAHTLFKALKSASDNEQRDKVESARAAQSQGWGGSLGRHLATGAGVVAGGVLLGVTGGLAAPAIAAVLAPLGIGTVLSASAAPVVLGTLFGVGGGGLAGRRVRERWRGVEEFSFIEIGDGNKATQEEIDDLQASSKKVKDDAAAKAKEKAEKKQEEEKPAEDGSISDEQAAKNVEAGRLDIEQRLLSLTLKSGTRTSISESNDSFKATPESPRVSLDKPKDEKAIAEAPKPPSLTATIVAPGLLTVSRTEAISAWRAICSSVSSSQATLAPRVVPREKGEPIGAEEIKEGKQLGLKDGRDVYLLRFESAAMLKTGQDVEFWVESKLKGYVKKEIIKRTLLNAYFAAVSLPLTVYSMASMTLDNTWVHAQDRAKKAGRLLGEVIEKRVQGERPVILIGSSVGALTIQHALLYLASLPTPPGARSSVPAYVESAFLISLPAAPTQEEWQQCRSVVARRLVNVWSDSDFVLAGVVRLHEVVSKAAMGSSGIRVAGLGLVEYPGVENVDVSSVLRGHMELQAKMPEILDIINVDA
ncbi:hypothetical protein L202_01006 [Cryptococcus amylolentus CBS 6039]|uniref:Uncharacterized protein n=2 Tax=Cryptococcus amylolentus TaxID=104669 RepID=A0A1E3I245_9TREE|nr:hypothetical protein L202_01006 [Cryptococcus amylolentus CBS 6039]ODN82720.1 hypothetical protein L202_01006 [Cryptococcus amylolentus CBS 6039]ODO10400.1 hypothetical protein I350_00995 [Cryptococcus amylolentus CBS 6273]